MSPTSWRFGTVGAEKNPTPSGASTKIAAFSAAAAWGKGRKAGTEMDGLKAVFGFLPRETCDEVRRQRLRREESAGRLETEIIGTENPNYESQFSETARKPRKSIGLKPPQPNSRSISFAENSKTA